MDRVRLLNRPHPGFAALLGVILCIAATGCGSGRTRVTGTVRCDGTPLPFGSVQFLGRDGVPHAASIQGDGTFSLEVPAGEAKVIVSCVDQNAQAQFASELAGRNVRGAPPRAPSGRFSLIPTRYTDWNESGLAVVLRSGQTVQDIDLTSR